MDDFQRANTPVHSRCPLKLHLSSQESGSCDYRKLIYIVRGRSQFFFSTHCVIMTLGGGGVCRL